MILCCGEALIDMIPQPTMSGRDGFVPHSGGAIFNTAIAIGRLDEKVGLLTGLSRDVFGQQLQASLRESGVNTDHSVMSDRPTTLAFVTLVDGHAKYSFFDENSAGRMLQPEDMPTIDADVSALYFGGISLACEPGADAYAALLERECDTRVVMIDPNIRPSFIQDEANYRARLNRMIGQSDILKVSDEDLDWLDPRPISMGEKAATILGNGPSLVIVTRGSQGASGFLANEGEVTVASQKVTVVDTVGAGDTFNAGVLAKLSRLGMLNKSAIRTISPEVVTQALTQGARVAAVTVSRAGANPPWAKEIDL